MRYTLSFAVAALAAGAVASGALAGDAPSKPSFGFDGTVHVPAFDLPPSAFLSPEALAGQQARAKAPAFSPPPDMHIQANRRMIEGYLGPQAAQLRAQYPVDVVEQSFAGIPTRVVTPKGKPYDPDRVLINLHGGAFSVCAGACALLESVPIAALGGYKVVTVNYRMAPEAMHPAGVEDVAAVYRELLKTYKPRHIGIYGCSAGGALTAQTAAWLPAHGLPQAGAIGIFGAGGVRFGAGDSAYYAGYADGFFPPPAKPGQPSIDLTHGYFNHADMNDPMISPALHPDVIKRFPPTLLITGTRAMDMSPAIFTNSQLLKAGVRSTLIVGEGMGHCYIYQGQLPEARDAWAEIVAFFKENLK